MKAFKVSKVTLCLICLVALTLFFSISAIPDVMADNARPYFTKPDKPYVPRPVVIENDFVTLHAQMLSDTE